MHAFAILSTFLYGAAVVAVVLAFPNFSRSSHVPTERIVGGHEVEIGDVPFQVSVQSLDGHFCGGSLISQQWIITAGHCANTSKTPNLSVRVGSSYNDRDGQVIDIAESIRHPLYDASTFDYDFSLLKLGHSLIYSDHVSPVQLPREDDFFQDGTMCAVSGWGDTFNPAELKDRLRAADVALVNDAVCQTAYISWATITERMVCAGAHTGGAHRDACQGDTGGPLVYENTLIGIVSWRNQSCTSEKQLPGVYGRVTSVRTWIKEVTNV